jgi:hypothetical protein
MAATVILTMANANSSARSKPTRSLDDQIGGGRKARELRGYPLSAAISGALSGG